MTNFPLISKEIVRTFLSSTNKAMYWLALYLVTYWLTFVVITTADINNTFKILVTLAWSHRKETKFYNKTCISITHNAWFSKLCNVFRVSKFRYSWKLWFLNFGAKVTDPKFCPRSTIRNLFYFESPYGILGEWFNSLYFTHYLKRLLEQRNATIKKIAESEKWKKILIK